MSRLKLAILIHVVALTAMSSRGFAVANAVVGACTAGTHFTTIQTAVNAATVGSTVKVCPGTYPEQVVIQANLKLMAVTSGVNNSVTITQPAGGLFILTVSGLHGALAPQVYVHNATATLTGIAVDGTLPSTASCPNNAAWVGILYQGGGGLLTNSVVQNAPNACGDTYSVLSDATLAMQITNNVISGSIYGVQVDYASGTTTVSGNAITGFPTLPSLGIFVEYASSPVTVANNVLSGVAYGLISGGSSGTKFTGNTVLQSVIGVYMQGASSNVVQSNHLDFAQGAGIYVNDGTAGGNNTITKNTIVQTATGLLLQTKGMGDVVTPNTYVDVQANVQ